MKLDSVDLREKMDAEWAGSGAGGMVCARAMKRMQA